TTFGKSKDRSAEAIPIGTIEPDRTCAAASPAPRNIIEMRLEQPGLEPVRKDLLRDAEGFYEAFLAEHAGDPSLRVEAAGGRRRPAGSAGETGPPAVAADQYRRAIALWEDILKSHPGRPEYQEELAQALGGRAALFMRRKDHRAEALDDCRRARGL